ncbi:MAG: DUF2283 domain-containing protein [Patescibacteria group bacterium]|nr:DUF2283 domain-containing protein [Patescibacteria group bacterium]MDE1945234.1 DUF2283 domain-containing protein [Patescibacteria group bacterium]MDE2057969.1 DUF2283 domain-containing protein [Patescibacteria group bacterium]
MQKARRQRGVSRPDGVLSLKHGVARVSYDPVADAAYFALKRAKKGEAVKTVELQPWLLADLDKKGALLGIEMLFVSRRGRRSGSRVPATLSVPAIG